MRSCVFQSFSLLCAMLCPIVVANDDDDLATTVPATLVHTEVGGGSDSAVSPDGKYIAFSSRRNGNLDIYTVEVATGAVRQITTHPDTDNEARWHPDGTHLIFVTMRNGSQDIYTVDLESLEETAVATEDYNEDYPSFSKDGTKACFTGGPRGFREVQIHDFKTGETRTITRGYGYVGSTNFSPDGKQVVFHAYYDNSYASGKADIYIVPAAGGKPVNVTKDRDVWDYKPNWSFDGDWITFSSKRGTPNFNLWVMHPDGSDLHSVTAVQGPVPMRRGEVSMSNSNVLDQRWSNWTKDGRIGWHQINVQRGLLKAVNVNSTKVTEVFESEFAVFDLALSPDGSKLVFEADAQLFVMDAAPGATPEEIGYGLKPRWSRDGSAIHYLEGWPRRHGRLDLATGETTATDLPGGYRWPESGNAPWSPDGTWFATIQEGDTEDSLIVVDADGDTHALATGNFKTTTPVWSADGIHVFFADNVPPSVSYFVSDIPVNNRGLDSGTTGAD